MERGGGEAKVLGLNEGAWKKLFRGGTWPERICSNFKRNDSGVMKLDDNIV